MKKIVQQIKTLNNIKAVSIQCSILSILYR